MLHDLKHLCGWLLVAGLSLGGTCYGAVSSSASEGFIPVSHGGQLYYQEQGEGEPVILLHGHSLDSRMWDQQVPALADHYRVIRPDFRGYGKSSAETEKHQFTHVDDVITLMDSLHLDKAHVVGLSMGAFVAGDMVAMYPERMLSCLLASGGIRSTPGPHTPMTAAEKKQRNQEIAALKRQGIDQYKKEWIEVLMKSGGSDREQMRPALTRMVEDWSAWQPLHKEVRLFYAREAMDSLVRRRPNVPTLILTGENEHDGQKPAMLQHLPYGRHKVLANCGHMMNMDQPEAFNNTLLDFLAAHPRYAFVVDAAGNGDFRTIQEAIHACPDFRKWGRIVILVRKGTYHEKVIVPESKRNVTLLAEEGAVLTYGDWAQKLNRFREEVSTSGSATLFVFAPDFRAENLTIRNSAGPIGQAVACMISADRVSFKNCRFEGHQDTIYTYGMGDRLYFSHCYIEGTVDYIFGWSLAIFDHCQLHSLADGYITAPSTAEGQKHGYLFYDCQLTAAPGVQEVYLSRPWRPYAQAVFIRCEEGKHITPTGFDPWDKKEPARTTFYAEYECTGEGANANRPCSFTKQLNDLSDYDMRQILAGDDGWQPIDDSNIVMRVRVF